MIESRGTPVAILATESYENTHFYGSRDNGFDRCRRVVIDEAFKTLFTTLGALGDDNSATEATARNNAPITSMRSYMNQPAVSQRLAPRLTKTYNDSKDEMRFMNLDMWQMAAKPMIEQCEWALIGPRTADDINPPPVTNASRGALDSSKGWVPVPGAPEGTGSFTYTFTGANEADAIWKFNKYMMDEKIGDGMALVPPTPELVNEMLAGTARDRYDILGSVKMRSGTITVEKVAALGVMAGCKPEHMPILLAAAEIVGNSAEEDINQWHPMTSASGGLGIILLVSGPITKEIGMDSNVGEMGAGNPINNAIGRAFRLMFRNFAHNLSPDIDTSGYGTRLSDRTMFAVAENYDVLREIGWETHSEVMGFGAGSNSVTLIGTGAAPHSQNGSAYNASWTVSALADLLPDTLVSGGLSCPTVKVAAYSPAQARLMATTYATKAALMDAKRDSVAKAVGATERNTFQFPLVCGEDPGGTYVWHSSYYAATSYQSEKITGATLTTAGSDATVPSAPRNFTAVLSADGTRADLSWDPPASNGGAPIQYYEVYYFEGTHDMSWRWLEVPGGAAATSCYFTNLQPGIQYFFKIRANNQVDNARYFINRCGDSNMTDASPDAAYPGVRLAPRYALSLTATQLGRTAGKGGAAYAPTLTPAGTFRELTENQYPQLNGNPIKLYWGYPLNNGADESLYGPGTVIN